MFTNIDVPLDSLPASDDAQKIAPSPVYPKIVLGQALVFWVTLLLAAAALFGFVLETPATVSLAALGGGAAFASWSVWIAHKSAAVVRYAVREHDVIVWRGVFWRKETVQPLNRVQHVERVQGPLDKRFGLARLKLFSAGTGHLTFEIPGLEENTALRIQSFILEQKELRLETGAQETGRDTRPTGTDD